MSVCVPRNLARVQGPCHYHNTTQPLPAITYGRPTSNNDQQFINLLLLLILLKENMLLFMDDVNLLSYLIDLNIQIWLKT